MPKSTYLVLFFLLFLSNLLAQSTINVPGDFSTIQQALNNAGTGDQIIVSPGTYYENPMWPDLKGIHLVSSGDSSNTIIDGGQNSCVIYLNSSTNNDPFSDTDTTVISGFTIRNGGNVSYGGGIFARNFHLKVNECALSNNTAEEDGGGIYADNCLTHIVHSRVNSNTSNYAGGGFYSGEGISYIDYCSFYSNTTRTLGGAVYASNEITASNSSFFNNRTTPAGVGGAIYFYFRCHFNITDCEIFENNALSGGGIFSIGAGELQDTCTIARVKIYNNSSGNHYGGGACITGVTHITDSEIFNNYGGSYGGGLQIKGSGNVVRNCIIYNNTAYYGGGIIIRTENKAITIQDSYIVNNTAIYSGGGVFIDGFDGEKSDFSNNTIIYNTAKKNGCGIYFEESSDNADISNCTIVGNQSGSGGVIYSADIPLDVNYSNFADNGYAYTNANSSYLVDATYNYWGDQSGPYNAVYNSSGQGDSVNNFVTITNWQTTPNTDAPPIPPLNLNAGISSNNEVVLTWDRSALTDLSHYKIYYDTESTDWQFTDSIDNIIDTKYSFQDLSTAQIYYFAVTTVDNDGNESWFSKTVSTDSLNITSVEDKKLPDEYTLAQNYPNPFNPATKISFTMPEAGNVELNVYNILGQKVAQLINNPLPAGYHTVEFNGSSLASGIYIYRINIDGKFNAVKKMLMLK